MSVSMVLQDVAGGAGGGGVRRVGGQRDGVLLARYLADPGREVPVVVVSEPAAGRDPFFDVPGLAGRVDGAAEVVVVAAEATFALTGRLGRPGSVFGGAARVYPADPGWTGDPRRLAPLFLCRDPRRAGELADALVEAALDAAFRAGRLPDTFDGADLPAAACPVQLRRENARLAGEAERARNRAEALERRVASLQRAARDGGAVPGPRRPVVYADPGQQFRHEARLAWLERVPEPDRLRWPLPESYLLGHGFTASLDALPGGLREKAVQVCVEVLTGLAREADGRRLHPWRASRSGPQETRGDGAAAWRASVQNSAPAARRLKFWRLPDGRIELDAVAVHDHGI